MPLPASPSVFSCGLGEIVAPGATVAFDAGKERLVLVCPSLDTGPPDVEIVVPDSGPCRIVLEGSLMATVDAAAPLEEHDFLVIDRATARRLGLAG
ncbi:MAG: hypothetical protein KDK24_03605 [Pseudooceanicola sp.]|nr:hypothetical protein [Pseudooceanicola sp.]